MGVTKGPLAPSRATLRRLRVGARDVQIPPWIKTTAGWWQQGTISDGDYAASMGARRPDPHGTTSRTPMHRPDRSSHYGTHGNGPYAEGSARRHQGAMTPTAAASEQRRPQPSRRRARKRKRKGLLVGFFNAITGGR